MKVYLKVNFLTKLSFSCSFVQWTSGVAGLATPSDAPYKIIISTQILWINFSWWLLKWNFNWKAKILHFSESSSRLIFEQRNYKMKRFRFNSSSLLPLFSKSIWRQKLQRTKPFWEKAKHFEKGMKWKFLIWNIFRIEKI